MNIQGENKDLELFSKEGVRVYYYYKNSDSYWYECTFDKKGNRLTYKNSDGVWSECTYDEKGNELTYKNSNGTKRGFDIPEYTMENLVEKLGNFKLIK